MKNFILFLLITGLFAGCSNNNSDFNPLGPSKEIASSSEESTNFVFLPKKNTLSFEKITSKQVTITPNRSKTITLKEKYRSGNDLIKIKMKLKFRKGTVEEKIKVVAEMDTDIAGGKIDLKFGPSPITFKRPVLLDFKITGLSGDDLERFKEIKRLVHISPNGDLLEELSFNYLGVKKDKFICKKAKILHFSRFGFVR